MKKDLITFIISKKNSPSYRLRIKTLKNLSLKEKFKFKTILLPKNPVLFRCLFFFPYFLRSKIIIFSKTKLVAFERAFVKKLCPLWIYDLDDPVMYGKPKGLGYPPSEAKWRIKRFNKMVDFANIIVVATLSLKNMISNKQKKVYILPTPVDLSKYPKAKHFKKNYVILGWIGLGKNLMYLQILKEVFYELKENNFPFELRIISNSLPDFKGNFLKLIEWTQEKEGEELSKLDIGLAPLNNDLWAIGKGGYKCIQYAAAGIPCIASPVGANLEIIQEGKTGFFAKSKDEWVNLIHKLFEDENLRREIGENARNRAEKLYDINVYLEKYKKIIEELLP